MNFYFLTSIHSIKQRLFDDFLSTAQILCAIDVECHVKITSKDGYKGTWTVIVVAYCIPLYMSCTGSEGNHRVLQLIARRGFEPVIFGIYFAPFVTQQGRNGTNTEG